MARYDDLNTKSIGYLTFLSCLLLAVTVLLLQALCYNWIDWQEESKLLKQSYVSSDKEIQSQKDTLTGYGKVTEQVPVEQPAGAPQNDSKKPAEPATKSVERIRIPIDKAETLLLEEVKAQAGKAKEAPKT